MKYFYSLLLLILTACGSVDSPDGGPYDETPPKYLGANVSIGETKVHTNKYKLLFDEFIRLDNAAEKVIVSPPQLNVPEITSFGKAVNIKLLDSLKTNTTYTIDFGDAVVDNNEGNPLGTFTYYFSTGEKVDTFEVAGKVLNAEDLEPIKGILVGLHSNLTDSAFLSTPFDRMGRTDADGRFTIKGVAPGKYRIYALKDADGNYTFSQRSEIIAVGKDTIIPSASPDIRTDTTWIDSVRIDSIALVHYTHFYPDNVILRAFKEANTQRYYLKGERPTPQQFKLLFTASSLEQPRIAGLNFDSKDLLAISNTTHDTLTYWINNPKLLQQDTLRFTLSYDKSNDTTKVRVQVTDTLELVSKLSWTKQEEEFKKLITDWEKQMEKGRKKDSTFFLPKPKPYLTLNLKGTTLSPIENPYITWQTPLAKVDTTGIKLTRYNPQDSIYEPAPFQLQAVPNDAFALQVFGAWNPSEQYVLHIDSATFTDIYGHTNKADSLKFSIASDDNFGTLFLRINGEDTTAVVQLLNRSGMPLYTTKLNNQKVAEFYYLKPETYYVRLFRDINQNGRWDTGDYEQQLSPEEVFYYPQAIEVPAKWDVEQSWTPQSLPLEQQKPRDLIKQKAETKKQRQSRNAERKQR